MASVVPQMSLFLGIIPALLLLWIGLRGYEGLYKDKTIFLTFIVGLILGFVAAIIELFTAGVGVTYIILFPLLEQMAKVIALNLGRFHEKRETVIYGLSLGLGFGSIFTPASLLILGAQVQDTLSVLLIVVGSFGIILFQATAGILIGYGVFRGRVMFYVLAAVLLEIPLTATIFVTEFYQKPYLQSLIVVYGAVLFWYVVRRIMPRIHENYERRKRTLKA